MDRILARSVRIRTLAGCPFECCGESLPPSDDVALHIPLSAADERFCGRSDSE